MEYVAVVHKDAESAYGVHFPDVPGCISAADTLDAVVVNAQDDLALHFGGAPPVAARTIDEVRASGEVDQDLAEGATLVLVPFDPLDRTVFLVDDEAWEKLQAALAAPSKSNAAMKAVFRKKSVWEK